MTMRSEVRKGVTQSDFNFQYSQILPWEIIIISVTAGIYFTSWWVFLFVFWGLLIGIQLPGLGELIVFILSAPIGAIFGFLGLLISGWGACITLGGIAYFATVAFHFASLQYNRDIGDT